MAIRMKAFVPVVVLMLLLSSHAGLCSQPHKAQDSDIREMLVQIAPFFRPPPEFADEYGKYRPVLKFNDGSPVKTPADWQRRRAEILETWHTLIGSWPPLIDKPKIEYLAKEQRESFTQHQVSIEIAPNQQTVMGYLLVPDGQGPFPAVLVVYYDAETGAGLARQADGGRGKELRDFGLQLTKRGFVTLSIGTPDFCSLRPPYKPLYDSGENQPPLQPLSALAYVAANCCNCLANRPEVEPARIGIVGHSYGGKWAMFASCLYEKFACAVWSDPGIVFDETRPNVNYWEPWYLGYERDKQPRRAGVPSENNPRTGPYKSLLEQGHDLHELHALMAPRPFLVSGGSEDPQERWKALNHTIAVNTLLGYSNRVAMTNRKDHTPTAESNEQIYLFFEHFLKPQNHIAGGGPPAITPMIEAPSDPALWPAWRRELARQRQQVRQRIGYDDRLYRQPEFGWVPSCYCCYFAMMFDEHFYNRDKNEYTIDSFIDHGIREFGGYDAIVLWHAYPRIGFDDRNQFDFYRDMPGGLDGLRALSQAIHKRGLKVFIDYNPWDTGTRREDKSDIDVLAELVKTIEADGIFLDTLHEGAAEFRRKLDAARPGVVLESELTLPVERIYDHQMSWAQWFKDSPAPGVLWNKWFERRHMMHQIKRWNLDHTEELHTAWMNGSGILVWENVFGSWVGWNARDRSVLKAMLPIQRRYVQLFAGEGWTPLVETEKPDVYASLWEGSGIRLWTLVNRGRDNVEGVLLKVPHIEGTRYFDLIAGREVTMIRNEAAFLEGAIGARGIGAFLSGQSEVLGPDFAEFLDRQSELLSLSSSDVTLRPRMETLREVTPTKKCSKSEVPDGVTVIPKTEFEMEVKFRNRECGFYQVPQLNESTHPRHGLHQIVSFKQDVQLTPYAIDLTPVTNAEFARFLTATGYKPRHGENFLKHWRDGAPPLGLENHPVVYVDLDDARAYATWAGKRLPTESEWQYAAQRLDNRVYSWGRVWEWTESERSDGRTRFCIIRGGSFYKAEGSQWYADGGQVSCNFAAKFILMWPGLDRCATIGFHCVVDLVDEWGRSER